MKDVPSEILRLSTNVTNALSAISSKGVSIPAGSKSDSLAGLIEQIATGADVSVVTATAPHVLAGDVFVDASGNEVVGTMPNNGSVSIVLEKNQTYTIPKGYHPGTGVVSRASGGEVEFTITVAAYTGSTVTATKGSLVVSGTATNNVCVLTLPEAGTWTIKSEKQGVVAQSETIEIQTRYDVSLMTPLTVSYSGDMTQEDIGEYRYFTLTSTGVLSLSRAAQVDYWICGGGGAGGRGNYSSTASEASGGGGGGGGYFNSGQNSTDTAFTITIGAAAANSSIVSASGTKTANCGSKGTSAADKTGGTGGAGASGGGGGYGSTTVGTAGSGGGSSTRPFGLSNFNYPCAGGNGGYRSTSSSYLGYKGGSNGANGTTTKQNTSAATGGGLANTAATYYGSGGGGGCGNSTGNRGGAEGYQGVCFLRIPRSEFGL